MRINRPVPPTINFLAWIEQKQILRFAQDDISGCCHSERSAAERRICFGLRLGLVVLLVLYLGQITTAAQNLDIYFIDVEGGQATLIVAASGESLLVDTGWPGFSGRDAERIVAAAHSADLKRIDYVLVTHYHMDHVGGVPQLAERIPIGTFIDHGPNAESGKEADQLFTAYQKAYQKAQHRVVTPGEVITLGQAKVEVLTSNGEHIGAALQADPAPKAKTTSASHFHSSGALGSGQPNPYCSAVEREKDDPSENARSVGILLTFGRFRFIDLGDLTWNKELDLMCPNNRVGTVDVYLTSHHGLSISGSKALVWALHPRVAIMNNGARKGGEAEAWQVVESSPGLEDLWQLHYALAGGKEHNVAGSDIANPDEKCAGKYLKLSAHPDGSFTVTNSRNGFSKTYPPVR
jgi:beta-lactamase superfamily II metal-dependent hydrolase